MKKFLLTLSLVLGFFTLAQAADPVTLPAGTNKWGAYNWATSGTGFKATNVDGYTLDYQKGNSSTDPRKPDDSSFRLYAKALLTVSSNDGSAFTVVKIKCASSNSASEATSTDEDWVVSTNGQSGAGLEVTFTSTTPKNSITFSPNAQMRIGTITITPEEVAGSVALPTISCENNTVTITAEEGADIYYTIDGTAPSIVETQKYSGPFEITKDETVKAIAVVGDKTSSVATVAVKYIGTYDGFAAFVAAGEGAEGKVNGPITVLYQNGNNLQVKDSKDAYMLVNGSGMPSGLVNGDALSFVQGTYGFNNTQPQISSPVLGEVTKGGVTIEPEELALNAITADKVNAYVKLTGVNVTDVNNRNFNLKDAAGNTLAGYNTFNISGLSESTGQTVIGFVRLFKGNVQIAPVSIEGGVVLEAVAEPTFSVAAGAVAEGTEVSISCATQGATIRYTTNGDDVTETSDDYSTAIVINKAMTIKAKAFKDGMTASEQAVASYSLSQSVDPEQPVITSTATFNFSDPTTLTPSYNADDDHVVDGVIFSNNNVTVVNEQNNATTAKLWAKGHQYRIYKNSTLKIAVKEGYKLTSISFECTEGLNGLSGITPGSFDSSTGVLTFNNVTANEVTCTLSEKVFITKITVKYAAVASAPAAPVLSMEEGYNTESPVNLTEYSNGEVKYFDVTVSWTEGMTLVYKVSARGTLLNGSTLEYPEQPEEESTPAAVRANGPAKVALKTPVTGTISDASSAVFSFASDGEFSCHVEDAAGNKSNAVSMTFQGQSTGVEDIIADGDNGEAVFYNMQGVRVANPATGNLYIKVQGDKATKVLVK